MVGILTDRDSEAGRLARSVLESDKRVDPFRRQRTVFLRELAGPYYGEGYTGERQPLNLIYSLITTLQPAVAMRKVRASVTTHKHALRDFADLLRLTVDQISDRVGVSGAIRSIVPDGFVGMGIIKTGIDRETGEMFVDPISLDDYIPDWRMRRRNRPGERPTYAYKGHRFRMSFELAMDSAFFKGRARTVVENMAKDQFEGQDRAEDISGKMLPWRDDFDPQLEFIEQYIPRRKSVVWLPGSLTPSYEYLHEADWYGHDDGPLDELSFFDLPDNAMSLPIVAIIYDLYCLENELARKIGRQALAQKDIAVGDIADQKGTETIRNAQDGEFVGMNNAEVAKMLSFGGANEKGYAAVGWFHDFLTRISGNTELVGGLKAQSGTLGQDQILQQGANRRLEEMRAAVVDVASSVIRKLAWYVWNDPNLQVDLTQKAPGGFPLPTVWPAGMRKGRLEDYDFGITAYSPQTDTPEARYQRVKDLVQNIILPIAPLAAQQGSHIDPDVLVNIAGRDLDIPEIEDLWIEGPPLQTPASPAGGEGGANSPMGQPGGAMPAMRPGQVPSPIEDMATAAAQPQGAAA